MANKARSEVSLQAGDETYTLRYTTNALAELEDALGMPLPRVGERLQSGGVGIKEIRALLWAGLLHRYGEVGMTLQAAGDIMDKTGIEAAAEAVSEAFQLAFPQAGGESKNAQKEAAGTGTAS